MHSTSLLSDDIMQLLQKPIHAPKHTAAPSHWFNRTKAVTA